VRALVRAGTDRSRLPADVETVEGDLNEPDSLRPHLRGVQVRAVGARARPRVRLTDGARGR
jgi:uncharacterized protein YbjT (DUF2867 family)